jgi:hypothetical protein
MTDNLRDRIAAVLEHHQQVASSCQCGFDLGIAAIAWKWREHVADAVILQLGLRPELGQRSKPTGPLWGGNNRYNVTRYVTNWENNDE